MTLYKWSQTTASNASADSTINWAEGQAPSSVNDSARAMMTAVSKYRDDISGAIATGGTSTAYTVTSYEVFDTLAHMANQMIAFTPHTTNAATVTLNVDGLGAKPLRSAPSTELLAGVLIQGTPYVATYNNSDAVWYLQNFYGNPYNIPMGGMIDYTGATAPNSAFVLPYGQAISRSTYASYYSLVGTTYGSGDGSTTFNVIDCRGRAVVGVDNMGGTGASRLSGGVLAATGGAQSATIAQNQLPNISPNFTGTASQPITVAANTSRIVQADSVGSSSYAFNSGGTGSVSGTNFAANSVNSVGTFTATGTVSSINGGVTQTALTIMPPYVAVNKILRIL